MKSSSSWWFQVPTHLNKYARQIGSFPQIGVNIRNIWNHHLVFDLSYKVVPLPVVSRLVTPLEGVITPVTHLLGHL